jgi:hypothetical protein
LQNKSSRLRNHISQYEGTGVERRRIPTVKKVKQSCKKIRIIEIYSLSLILLIKREYMKKVNVKALGNVFSIFGNKGNVWTDTAHAYQSGRGNLCGTPALSSNHAAIAGIEEVGCPECLKQIALSGYVQVPLNV